MLLPRLVVSIGLSLVASTAPYVLFAQTVQPLATEITIKSAYESALILSPEVQAQQKRLDALKANKEAAQSLTSQPLVLEGSHRTDSHYNNQGLRETEIGLSATLWNWNEKSATQAYRNSELEHANTAIEQKKLGIAGEVRRSYWDSLAAQLEVEIAQNRTSVAEQLLTDVKRRVEAGELAQADLLQASALHAHAQSEMGRAQSALATIGAQFSIVTGLPVSVLGQAHIENSLAPQLEPASQTHPDVVLGQAQATLEARKVDLAVTQKRANTEIGFSVISERSAFNMGSEKSLVVSTRIPLGNGPAFQGRVLDAQADLLLAQTHLNRQEKTVKARTMAARANLDIFEKLQHTASEQAQLSKKVFELYQRSFNLGETDLPSLLRYEQLAFEAERVARKTNIEYAARLSDLNQALGLLPE